MQYPRAIVNTKALINNIKVIKNLAPKSRVLAIIKANAYGHDLIEVAKTLYREVEGFGVARINEAEQLRISGIKNKILLLEGFVGVIELFKLNELKLSTVIHCFEQLEALENYNHLLKDLDIWIKFNTGMNRLGFDLDEVKIVKERLNKLSSVKSIKLMSHLQRADDHLEKEFTLKQINSVLELNKEYSNSLDISVSASSGILFYPEGHGEWIRPGIIIYGMSPNYDSIKNLGFKPAMNLVTSLIGIHKRKAGDTIGYSGTYTVKEDTYIGVVAMGYGDGYPREAPEGTPLYINGRIVPLVGRVSMDMLTVDLGPDCIDKVGDSVTVFGDELPVEIVAKHIGIISYELTTSLTERVKHEFIQQ